MSQIPLSQFQNLQEATKNRLRDPEKFRQALEDLSAGKIWERLQESTKMASRSVISGVRYANPRERLEKQSAARGIREGNYFIRGAEPLFARSAVVAIALGEIARMAKDGVIPNDDPEQAVVRSKLGEDEALLDWFPALAVPIGILGSFRHRIAASGDFLPLDTIWETSENFLAINEKIGTSKTIRATIRSGDVCYWGGMMSGAAFLREEDFPDALEKAYKEHWHTKPLRKHPGGLFVQHLRERIIQHGTPELLVVLAASSDGGNRAVAGLGANTPPKVYEKLIYDNSLAVLSAVVRNSQFDNYKAYAMMETELAPQIVAVMLHGRVDMSVRVLAAKKAINHDQVDPVHIYRFLFENRTDKDVPHALWRDYVRATHTRLMRLRQGGEEKAIEAYEKRLARVRAQFVDDLLKPYAQAVKDAEQAEDLTAVPYYRQRWVVGQQKFVAANEFMRDPELFDILVEGSRTGDELLELMKMHREAKLPSSKKLLVKVLRHPERKIREEAIKMAPSMSEDEVAKMAKELEERVKEDYTAVKDQVLTMVIPDYEKIEGQPRKLSRMRYNFEAAKILSQEVLVEAFVKAAEKDPRTIPDEFRLLTDAFLAKKARAQHGNIPK